MKRVKIVGNHSNYHAGCEAVWSFLTDQVSNSSEITTSDDYDILVVNGEGSMHHGRPSFHRKMIDLRNALESGRQAYLINTVWQDNPNTYDDVLKNINGIVVREILSQRDLLEKHGINSSIALDFSYWYSAKEPNLPVFDYQGKIVITDFYSPSFQDFVIPTGGEFSRYPRMKLNHGNWSWVVESLRTARLLITGRHHAVYAACRARIPFIALIGNSHKIEGLILTSGVDLPICNHPSDLLTMTKKVESLKDSYEKLFNWMENQKPWKWP